MWLKYGGPFINAVVYCHRMHSWIGGLCVTRWRLACLSKLDITYTLYITTVLVLDSDCCGDRWFTDVATLCETVVYSTTLIENAQWRTSYMVLVILFDRYNVVMRAALLYSSIR